MKIERVELFALRLPLKAAFVSAEGSTTERDLAILRITDENGLVGLGEITSYPGPGGTPLGELIEGFELHARHHIEGANVDVEGLQIPDPLPAPVDAAIDVALLDLRAKREGVRVADLIGTEISDLVDVNATIASHSPDDVAEQGRIARDAGFGTIKLKVGMQDDKWRVSALRDAIGFKTRIRLDANGSWYTAEAMELIAELTGFGIELIEQPVDADDIQGMHRVRDSAIVPIVADEGVRTAADLERHIANGACDGVAIKLSQVGGIAAAAQLADTAKQAGLLAFVTSALDGPIGLAAGLHFAAARPDFEVANGLATGGLFLDHYATEMLDVVDGQIALPDGPGLGVEIDEDALAEWAIG